MAEGTEVIQSLFPLLLLYFSGSLFSLCSSFCLPLPLAGWGKGKGLHTGCRRTVRRQVCCLRAAFLPSHHILLPSGSNSQLYLLLLNTGVARASVGVLLVPWIQFVSECFSPGVKSRQIQFPDSPR